MHQQQKDAFQDDEQLLFDYLTTNIHFNSKEYGEADLDVDLVFKMEVPSSPNIVKDNITTFGELFQNVSDIYEEVYQVAEDYVYFLTDNDEQITDKKGMVVRNATFLQDLQRTKPNFHKINFQQREGEELVIDCDEEYSGRMDVFTLQYNMMMIILQSVCGFNVKTYLFGERQEDGKDKKYVYFLISQNMVNLMKLADKYNIQKEIGMTEIDFCLNDPMDSSGRPLKYNSIFGGESEYQRKQKIIGRLLNLKKVSNKQQIYGEVILNEQQTIQFQKYCQEVQAKVASIFLDESIVVTPAEKKYMFTHNRRKINKGCFRLLQEMKKKTLVFEAIAEINKKYGYPSYSYGQSFFPFRLLAKNRPFFQKLRHILTYKYVVDSPLGDLALFNRMERIKLAHLCLEQYFKIQNMKKIGVQIFALNNDFERHGQVVLECEELQEKERPIVGGLNGKTLTGQWHTFLPFLSCIRSIRDYLGQQSAFQILLKIKMINFFFLVVPFAVAGQLIILYLFEGKNTTYIFSLCEITFVVISLSVFIVAWKGTEQQFFDNYYEKDMSSTIRQEYKGPYFRDCVTDNANYFQFQKNIKNRSINLLAYLGMGAILVAEGFCFYGIRMLIVNYYQIMPVTHNVFIIVPHLVFYGIFFVSNFILEKKLIHPLIVKIAGLHNHPQKATHESQIRFFSYIYTFSIELVGPLFFMIVEPFNGTSCYAAECMGEFINYIYSRYAIIFLFIAIRLVYIVYYYLRWVFEKDGRLLQEKTYHARLNFLLGFVQKQSLKEEISFNLKEQTLALYYFCIFSITFPFCAVLAFGGLYLEYILKRIEILRIGRRPIPKRQDLVRVEDLFENILHLCIVVNAWMICYSYEFLEYDLSAVLEIFVTNVTKDSILGFKIVTAAVLIIALEIVSTVVKSLMRRLVNCELQNRKLNKYKEYLLKTETKPPQKDAKDDGLMPVKTIFRTFAMHGLVRYKNNRVDFRKMFNESKLKQSKNRSGDLYDTNSEVIGRRFTSPIRSINQPHSSNHVFRTESKFVV